MRKFILFFVLFMALCVVGAGVGLVGVYFWAASDLPGFKNLTEYRPPVVTTVTTHDGKVLGNLFAEKRFLASLSEMPPFLPKAFLAAEDSSFYQHEGVDPVAIFRAFVKNLQAGTSRQGGSTITQQIIKRLLLTPERSFKRKIKEAILAYRLERYLTKDEILTIYLNQIFFGSRAYGVESAARTFFGVHVKDLTLAQAAVLAGLPPAPSRYNPYKDPDAAKVRQKYVLGRMLELGWISQADHDKAVREPLVYKAMEEQSWGVGAYYLEEVRRWLVDHYGEDTVYTGGLKVVTGCDLFHQEQAEKALRGALVASSKRRGWRGPVESLPPNQWNDFLAQDVNMDQFKAGAWAKALVTEASPRGLTVRFGKSTGTIDAKFLGWTRNKGPRPGDVVFVSLAPEDPRNKGKAPSKTAPRAGEDLILQQEPDVQGGMVSMDPKSGAVLAVVGGFSFEKSQFNRATQALRQCGSTFKPIVYSAAIDEGMTPATRVMDSPFIYEDPVTHKIWKPENYEGGFQGEMSLRSALAKSRNLVTIRVAQQIGIQKVIQRAKDMGIESELGPYLPISLGAGAVHLINLCQAYTAFANGGESVKPRFVLSVTGPDGQELYKSEPERRQSMSPQTAFIMDAMLREVVRAGTAGKATVIGKPIAGKTGTTNDEQDAWFIGFTPYLLTGVYLGFDQVQSMGKGETGGTAALPAFIEYRMAVEPFYPTEEFPQPPGIAWASVDGVQMPFKEGQDRNAFAGIIGGDGNVNFSDPNAPLATGEDLLKQMY
ncbi:Penicillin-binding protein 1A [Fundidesulfovibrio magnetotacticus]|uniref:Penicillin-binding protein 1A n=1 Tax=Fundidesulfovibrio magnetotacticus TaxID=2730080 RepID=A0A6V8LR49_9BACT|nr:PBP1A family penicillin-binding protein [Fundidesulfovibrio magnetotacticus]GFK94972.1 Penicillin-binding protein 1A [Fundidesulfovibrio magnetotacticus]